MLLIQRKICYYGKMKTMHYNMMFSVQMEKERKISVFQFKGEPLCKRRNEHTITSGSKVSILAILRVQHGFISLEISLCGPFVVHPSFIPPAAGNHRSDLQTLELPSQECPINGILCHMTFFPLFFFKK